MKKLFLLIVIALVTLAVVNAQEKAANPKVASVKKVKRKGYTYEVISTINNTYGYDVYSEEKIFIHQSSVPGVPGNRGFKTKVDAEKVAKIIIRKLKKGQMPPTITVKELLDAGVSY